MDGNDDLPNEFDVIVVGTGMVESILAAGASRIGKTVLHLDRNMYYGDLWATIGLENLEDFARAYSKKDEVKEAKELEFINSSVYLMSSAPPISNLSYKWFIPSSLPESKEEETVLKENKAESMKKEAEPDLKETEGGDAQSISSHDLTIENKNISIDNITEAPITDSETMIEESSSQDEKNTEETIDECQVTVEESHGDEKEKIKEEVKKWTVELLKQQSRKFNLDLAPKVIYAGGAMVELLLRSCVHRYTEFQSVSKILSYMESSGHLEEVPCTKSQVFSCKTFSIIDKRILMKVINYCVNFDPANEQQYEELKDQIFIEVLKSKNIPDHLICYILHSVAMTSCSASMANACSRIKLFFNNVGRYGHSPFLWPLYGSGELLQAFCRLSAVYGGVYYLGRGAEAVLVSKDTQNCTGIVSSGKEIKAQHFVTSAYTCPKDLLMNNSASPNYISRTILFTDRPLHERGVENPKESILILHMPSKDNASTTPIEIVQLPSITGACPKQLYVVQITCEQSVPCWSEVKEVVDKLFIQNSIPKTDNCALHEDSLSQQLVGQLTDTSLRDWFTQKSSEDIEKGKNTNETDQDKPTILFAFHYDIADTKNLVFSENKPANLHFCHGPDSSIDFDRAIKQAKELFSQMYPDEEFLPPTPDPNEITLSDLIGESNENPSDENKTLNKENEETETTANDDKTQSPETGEMNQDQKPAEE